MIERDFLLDKFDPFEGPTPFLRIVREVCVKHRVSYREVMSSRRARRIAWPRQEIMYRASKETSLTLPAIGRYLGDRDHTTVMHGIERHSERMSKEAQSA